MLPPYQFNSESLPPEFPHTLHLWPCQLLISFLNVLVKTSILPPSSLEEIIEILCFINARSMSKLPPLGVFKTTGSNTRPAAVVNLRSSPHQSGSSTPDLLPSDYNPPLHNPSDQSLSSPAAFYSTTSNASPSTLYGHATIESSTWNVMRLLLSGPYSSGVGKVLKRVSKSHSKPSSTVPYQNTSEQSLLSTLKAGGALRFVRLSLRKAAEGRLARQWLSGQVNSSFSMTGAPTFGASVLTGTADTIHVVGHAVSLPGLPSVMISPFGIPSIQDQPGSHPMQDRKSVEDEVIDRAWGREGEGGAWELEKVVTFLPSVTEIWVKRLELELNSPMKAEARVHAERTIQECLAIVNDIIEEVVVVAPSIATAGIIPLVDVDSKVTLSASAFKNLGNSEGRIIGQVLSSATSCLIHPQYVLSAYFGFEHSQTYLFDC